MKCLKCGLSLPADSEFCQYCGARLNQDVETELSTENPAVTLEPDLSTEQSEVQTAPVEPDIKVTAFQEVLFLAEDTEETKEPVRVTEECPLDDSGVCDVQLEPDTTEPLPIPEEEPSAKPTKKKDRYCKRCGGLIDRKTKKCSKCGKQYFRVKIPAKKSFLILMLGFALLGSVGLNVGQYILSKSTIASLEKTISNQKSTLASRQNVIGQKSKEIDGLESELNMYKSDFKLMTQGNVGYASSNFKADKSVIVLSKGETKKFTLTANWSNGGTVSVDYSHRLVAFVSFDNDSWYTSTKMTVDPVRTGSTVVTFSNNVNSQTFKILIIVTE